MPVISYGSHTAPADGACLMESVSILAGERFTDHPRTAYPLLAAVARSCNDAYGSNDVLRQGIAPLAVRFVGTAAAACTYNATHAAVGHETTALGLRIGMWAMEKVAPYIGEDIRLQGQQTCAALDRHLNTGEPFVTPHTLQESVMRELSRHRFLNQGLGAVKKFVEALTGGPYSSVHLPEYAVAQAVLGAIGAVVAGGGRSGIAGGLGGPLGGFDPLPRPTPSGTTVPTP